MESMKLIIGKRHVLGNSVVSETLYLSDLESMWIRAWDPFRESNAKVQSGDAFLIVKKGSAWLVHNHPRTVSGKGQGQSERGMDLQFIFITFTVSSWIYWSDTRPWFILTPRSLLVLEVGVGSRHICQYLFLIPSLNPFLALLFLWKY